MFYPRSPFFIINAVAHGKTKSFIKLKKIRRKHFVEAVVENTLKLMSIRLLKLFYKTSKF